MRVVGRLVVAVDTAGQIRRTSRKGKNLASDSVGFGSGFFIRAYQHWRWNIFIACDSFSKMEGSKKNICAGKCLYFGKFDQRPSRATQPWLAANELESSCHPA